MTIFDRDSVTDPGRDLYIQRNSSGGTILKGTPVILDTSTLDGVRVTNVITAALLSIFAGIAFEDIADGAYGRFQKAGYCDYARVAGHASNATVIGDVLGLVAAQTYLQRIAAGDGRPAFATSLEIISIGAAVASKKIWLGPGC